MSLSKLSLLCQNALTKERLKKGVFVVAFAAFILKKSGLNPKEILYNIIYGSKKVPGPQKSIIIKKKNNEKKALNKDFLKQLLHLLRIIIPGVRSKQFLLLLAQTLTLIFRTLLSVVVAKMDGQIVKSIVQKAPLTFASSLLRWLLIAVPATFTNSLIRFLEAKIALSFQSRLVSHAYQLYFKNQTYYRVSNLDSRLTSVDQNLTEDLSTFSSSLSHLFSHLTKPLLDILVVWVSFSTTAKRIGASIRTPSMIGLTVFSLTAFLLRKFSPQFGRLISQEAEKKGLLRAAHARIINNAEEIAFYGGHKAEEAQLMESYRELQRQSNKIYWKKLWYVHMEQFLMKYVWSAAGLLMITIPIISVELESSNHGNVFDEDKSKGREVALSTRTQLFTTSRSLLLSLADAFERLMSSYKEITELAGHTQRVSQMLGVFHDVSNNKCIIIMNNNNALDNDTGKVAAGGDDDDPGKVAVAEGYDDDSVIVAGGGCRDNDSNVRRGDGNDDGDVLRCSGCDNDDAGKAAGADDDDMVVVMRKEGGAEAKKTSNHHHHHHQKSHRHHPHQHHHHHHHHADEHHHQDQVMTYRRGVVLDSSHDISLEGVAIVTPTNHVVVRNLTFKLEKGMDLLVTGPNGCGKSSLFRVLSGLWLVAEGVVKKPPPHSIFYIPQRPYMTVGTLRDQLIYPDQLEDMVVKGILDSDLMEIVTIVGLMPLLNRKLTWDSVCDWKSVLSGGEKQKIGMARIFYHRPQYAFLDECSSAISIDYEASIYEALKKQEVTILSISHRPSLWKFHSHLLQFNGDGGWRFEELNQDTMLSLKGEKNKLEEQLSDIPEMERRLREVCKMLGEDSEVLGRLDDDLASADSSISGDDND